MENKDQNRMPCPLNEFTEHCTADMPSSDYMWHCWMQPEYKKAREQWEKKLSKK